MSFTTWAALETTVKDLIADHITNGTVLIGQVSAGDKSISYRKIEDLYAILEMARRMQAIESPTPATRVSYSRYRVG